MATTNYGVNHNMAVKLWSRKLFEDALKTCWMSKFIGKSSDSAIQMLTDTQKGPGDRIRVGLRMQLSGAGIEGDSTLEGNEEALSVYTDDLLINQLRHAVRSQGKMSEQRIPFSVREEARQGLTDWWSDRIDTALFNQLAGNTGQTDTRYTGHNATIAPTSSTNWVFANGSLGVSNETQVASASASNIFKLSMIDALVEKAKTNSPMIRPIKVDGKDKYLMFLHPYQVTDLRQNTNSGQWLDINKAVYQGSKASNPIYDGSLGEYNGVILHESTRVPTVTSGVYRAIFMGSQAGVIGFGQDGSPNKASWHEELFDYGNQLGVEAGMIWGAKKAVFNSADFGVIVLSTYAAAH
jgi:N4-gp56 family major capsid protein